jgi:hypothetical protein
MAVLVIIYLYSSKYTAEFQSTSETLEHRMNSLIDGYTPEYLYLDVDFINLYYSVKDDLASYNSTNFYRIVTLTDDLLQLRSLAEMRVICKEPIVPDLYLGELRYNTDTQCTSTVKDLDKVYFKAKEISQSILNYLNGFVLGTALSSVIESKFLVFQKRLAFLLKRNVNIIKTIYKNSDPKQTLSDHIAPMDNLGEFNMYPEW